MGAEGNELIDCGPHFQLHDHMLKQNQEMIGDLFDKYNALASLPEKFDTQTELLREINKNLSILPEHRIQLALLTKVAEEFNNHVTTSEEYKKCIIKPMEVKVTKLDPEVIASDHDKVTKMSTEWHIVKYVIPLIASGMTSVLLYLAERFLGK